MTDDDSDRTDPLALGNQLCFSVYSAGHAFTRLYRQLLEPIGLTYTQYVTLLVLLAEDGLTVREIGARLALDSGTLTPVLRRLETAGYVQRIRDTRDERLLRIHPTAAIRDQRPALDRIRRTIGDATGLEPVELAALQAQVETLRTGLEAALQATQTDGAPQGETTTGAPRE